MANPPITIGPLANVPAPGSPIRSDWPQEITTDVVALLNRQPKTWTAFGIAGTSGGSFANIQAQTVPAQSVAGLVLCWSILRIDMGTMSGDYTLDLKANGGAIATRRVMATTEASRVIHVALSAIYSLAASTAVTINLDGSGTANVTTYAVNSTNRLDLQWVAVPFTAT